MTLIPLSIGGLSGGLKWTMTPGAGKLKFSGLEQSELGLKY